MNKEFDKLITTQEGLKMKKTLTVVLMISATQLTAAGYNSSPSNFQNSESNYENSSTNFKNSPGNFANSPNNFNSTNGIYDNSGNRTGYSVPKQDGGVNLYTNEGYRYGYKPAR